MRIFAVESLTAMGLRIRGVEELSVLIHDALSELGLLPSVQVVSSSSEDGGCGSSGGSGKGSIHSTAAIDFPDEVITAPLPMYAAKPLKLKKSAWEDTYESFMRGASIEVVAIQKGIQVQTVTSHLLDAFKFGKPMNLKSLCTQASMRGVGPPNVCQWRALEAASNKIIESNVYATPWSGPLTELLNHVDTTTESLSSSSSSFPMLQGLFVQGSVKREFTSEEAAVRAEWFSLSRWWQAFRSCGYHPPIMHTGTIHTAVAAPLETPATKKPRL